MDDRFNTPWRLTATSIYERPRDARVFGHMDCEVDPALDYIAQRRADGVYLTLVHLLTAALARALAEEVPELNCYVRRGRVIPRKDIGIMVPVDAGDANLAVMVVREAHRKTASELAQEIAGRAAEKRQESGHRDRKNGLGRVPWPFRRLAFRALRAAVHEGGLELGGLGPEVFGSALLTNIGSFGLNSGFAALLPASNLPIVIAVGRAEKRAVVRDDAVVIRHILPLSATFDHRLVDGRQAGKLAGAVLARMADPASLDRAASPS